MTILIVDADQTFRESVTNLLLASGVEKFEVASSTEEALEKISKTFFDIILVDLFLPQMNGLRFAQEYRKRMPKAKIILLIEDGQLPVLKRTGQTRLDFPSILKSFVSHILPQLLSEELNSMSEKT